MEISFARPLLLFLLVLPAAILMWNWMRQSRRLVLPLDHSVVRSSRVWRLFIDSAQSLFPLLLAIAIVLLAGPQKLGDPRTKRMLTNIEFCVDVSGSMTAKFGEGSRYDASMEAINAFLDYRSGDAFGLTFFGTVVLHWVPLTSDPSAFRCAPPFMKPRNLPTAYGGTAIGKALLACMKVLASREQGDRMIILISDGSSIDLLGGNDVSIAKRLRDNNIIVYAIHVSEGSVPPPIVTITSMTKGEVFEVGDPEALQAVFKRIDTMQETQLVKTGAETLDNFFPYSVAGLSLLGMVIASSFGLRYTPW